VCRPSSFRGGGDSALSALPPIVIGAPCPLAVYYSTIVCLLVTIVVFVVDIVPGEYFVHI